MCCARIYVHTSKKRILLLGTRKQFSLELATISRLSLAPVLLLSKRDVIKVLKIKSYRLARRGGRFTSVVTEVSKFMTGSWWRDPASTARPKGAKINAAFTACSPCLVSFFLMKSALVGLCEESKRSRCYHLPLIHLRAHPSSWRSSSSSSSA